MERRIMASRLLLDGRREEYTRGERHALELGAGGWQQRGIGSSVVVVVIGAEQFSIGIEWLFRLLVRETITAISTSSLMVERDIRRVVVVASTVLELDARSLRLVTTGTVARDSSPLPCSLRRRHTNTAPKKSKHPQRIYSPVCRSAHPHARSNLARSSERMRARASDCECASEQRRRREEAKGRETGVRRGMYPISSWVAFATRDGSIWRASEAWTFRPNARRRFLGACRAVLDPLSPLLHTLCHDDVREGRCRAPHARPHDATLLGGERWCRAR